ncbi:hypothetical protein HK099_002736 [Clydaea vesicula]|uniref:Uncharacterized protein n=1 Tax=Clydaea vesicula TaxID=447962 RepID=A0AAD5U2M9_9FUNG|nr:hypothetical protein HK099_002736 [Clydaea vesicula]
MTGGTAFVVTASILLTVMLYLNFIPHEIVLSQLDLMVIPLSGKIYVFGLAMCNFVLCWLGEVFLFPKISDFIGYLDLVRVCYNLRKSEAYKKDFLDEEVALVPNNNNFSNEGIQIENKNKEKEFFRNEAKILHWKSKNKIFKIVDFRFKEEIQNLIALH